MIKIGIVLIVLQAIATIASAAAGMFHLNGIVNALGYFSISIVGIILIIVGYRKKHKHNTDQNDDDDDDDENHYGEH